MRKMMLCIIGVSLLTACVPRGDFDAHLNNLTAPHRFRLLRWEMEHLPYAFAPLPKDDLTEGAKAVRLYIDLQQAIRAHEQMIASQTGPDRTTCPHCEEYELEALLKRREAMRPRVQGILMRQVEATLHAEGITNPWSLWPWHKVLFPPVRFILSEAPHTLIVSPRDRIESIREVLLVSNLSIAQMEAFERAVERLEAIWAPRGVSALVEEIGGFGGTFPTLVVESSSLPALIETISEEWVHQYLAFTPLGFRYALDLLGIRRDYEIARLNETAAGIVAKELRERVLALYYPDLVSAPRPEGAPPPPKGAFDYNRFMRETRLEVDRLLGEGKIEEAEAYMEMRRQRLLEEGYVIRRLNQAYFAFHGTYAGAPTSVDPIGEEMRNLRAQSASLAAFLKEISRLTSREALQKALGRDAP